jgi:predicted alpha/beta superfamily hydrolase
LEFKITRGNWDTVEKTATGSDRPNRSLTLTSDTKAIDVTVERWGNASPRASTVIGTLKLHEIDSAALKTRRNIRVWLPAAYDADPAARFDVLYLHDGQNCFDAATSSFGNEWRIDESLTKLIEAKTIRPLIVVGVDNGQGERINELSYGKHPQHGGGNGEAYATFLLSEVKPLIEKTYRTQTGPAHTFLGGSSLGGLASLEIARRHPGTFGGVMAMSPSLWWPSPRVIEAIEQAPKSYVGTRIWLDMGTRESGGNSAENQQHIANARRLDAVLTKQNVQHRLLIDNVTGEHNEPAWARRFPEAITYLLNGK